MSEDVRTIPIDLANEADLTLANMTVRPSLRCVIVNGAEEQIEPRVMQVLVCLAKRRGEVVSRDNLIAQCWGGRVVGDDAINRPIAMVRKLGETTGAFSIETVPRIGYRLKASGAAAEEKAGGSVPQGKHLLGRRVWVMGAGAVVLVLALAVAAWSLLSPAPPVSQRVAFFGLQVEVGDAEAGALALTTSSIILGTFASLEIDVAPTADTEDTAPRDRLDRTRNLGATYAISGSVNRTDGILSISILVEDASLRTTLWSDHTPGEGSRPAALATQATAQLSDKLLCVIKVRSSLPANDARIVSRLPEACNRAAEPGYIERWRELIELAPNSAWVRGRAAVAIYNALPDATPSAVEELTRLADESVKKGMELDRKSPDVARARLDAVRFHDGTLADIEAVAKEALKDAPHAPNLLGGYGALLVSVGRAREAAPYGLEAMELDPLSAPKLIGVGQTVAQAGMLEKARELYDKMHAQFPGRDEWQIRMIDGLFKAGGDADRVFADPPPQVSEQMKACYKEIMGLVRQKPRAAKEAAKVAADCMASGTLDITRGNQVRAFLGDYEGIFAFRDDRPGRIVSEPPNPFRLFLFDPDLSGLRADPRFEGLAQRLGFIDYWKQTGTRPDFCATETVRMCDGLGSQ